MSEPYTPPEGMKLVRARLGALTRVEWTGLVLVPAHLTEADVNEIVEEQLYDAVDGGEYSGDPHYWEKGSCFAEPVRAGELPPGPPKIAYKCVLRPADNEDDEEDTCSECGGELDYQYAVANGDVCVCKECGHEELTASAPDEDEEGEEGDPGPGEYAVVEVLDGPPGPAVKATVHTDDYVHDVSFDAAGWFAQASDEEISALRAIGWKNEQEADWVAELFDGTHPEVTELFRYLAKMQGRRNAPGFECEVDEGDAVAWVRANRPALAAKWEAEGDDEEGPADGDGDQGG